MSRIMAIDFGRKRIGLALTDETELIIRPLNQIIFNRKGSWLNIQHSVEQHSPQKIIIGQPWISSKAGGPLAKEINEFKTHLQKLFPSIEMTLFDEDYSSKEAEAILKKNAARGQKHRKKKTDSVAAAIILRRYLDFNSGLEQTSETAIPAEQVTRDQKLEGTRGGY